MSRLPAPLRRRTFRNLWLAGFISDTGDWLLFIAVPIVVYDYTGSALGTALTFILELVPGILLAPVAGWVADRFDRRRTMIVVLVLQALALLPLLTVHDRSDLPTLYAVVVVEAVLFTMFDPAKNALMPSLLGEGELVAANSLIGLNQNLGRLVGGPLGGVLLAAGELPVIVVVDVVTYLLAAGLVYRMPADRQRTTVPVDGPDDAEPTASGYRAALRGRPVRAGIVAAFTSQIAQGLFVVLFVVFVAQMLGGGSAETGLLRGVQAIGAIAGGLALTFLGRSLSPGALTAWAATVFAVVDLLLWNLPAVSTATWIYVTLFILIGVPGILLATGMISALQEASTDATRGRVFSAYGLACNAGQGIGMLAGGLLAAPLGLLTLLNAQAVLYLVTGVVAVVGLRGGRRRQGGPAGPAPDAAARTDGPSGRDATEAVVGPALDVPASGDVLRSRPYETSLR